jgi:glutamate-1-semialdehyde 2,1-aminomutase
MASPASTADRLQALRDRYRRSRELYERASKRIPLGSQTFSKSHIQYPTDAAPLFLERGQGARVWDVDGNEYVDLVIALMPAILGYRDPDVDAAVREQLDKGISFSLATELEIELADRLCELIPCAEMVRFGKNGTDATSAALRLARAYTGRERVAVCGYHGWQDWYIGSTTRDKGVPQAVKELTSVFSYNDLDSLAHTLEEHPGEFAAVIMEPMNIAYPAEGFLEGVREMAHLHGALFVLDEIITGFRFDLGGAQRMFGVTPDLATFGKSMANGLPIAAVVGRAEIMREMEEIFFSSTFGGEALSLAASIATIDKLKALNGPAKLREMGEEILQGTQERIERHRLQDAISISGHPSWTILQFRDFHGATLWEIKSLYLQEMLARGVLTLGTHNLSLALTPQDLQQFAQAQDAALATVREALDGGNVRAYLAGEPMAPLFRVR